jgi:hypothetical protein
MTMTFDMTRIIAPVWRVCVLGACAAIAIMAPALSDRLGVQGNTSTSVRHAPLAATAHDSFTKRGEYSAKIADRINAVWGIDKNKISSALSLEPVRPAQRPDTALQIAGR